MKIFNTKNCALLLTVFLGVNSALALDQGTLQVTSITPTQTLATPDGNFENGWQWIFNVTVPTNEKVVRVKLANWTSGTSTIPTANNVRFYSPQSTNSNSTTTAKTLTGSNVYSDTISLSSSLDLSPSTLGRQIQIVFDVRVPVGTTGGSYASSYGISSDIDPAQATGVVQYTIDPTYEISSVNGNQTNQIIGQVLVTAQNEDVKLNTLTLDPKFSDPNINPTFTGLTNLKIFFNGSQIGSTTSWNLDPELSPLIFNFDSDVILPVGQQKTITVKSDINFLSSLTVSTGTLNTVIGGLTSNAQGVTTNRLISVFAVPFTLATTTLTNYPALSDVVFQASPSFTSTTKSPNMSGVKIGSYTIQAGSEAITLNQIAVGLTGTLLTSNQITNLTIKDGSTVLGTPIGNPTSNNNFSTNLIVNSTNLKTLDIYADFGSNAIGLNILPSMSLTIRGNLTNQIKVTEIVNGQTTDIASPIITSSDVAFVSSNSPVSQNIVGGQSGFQVGTFNFRTSNGISGAMLGDMTFTIPSNTIISLTVNGKSATVNGTSATIFNTNLQVPSSISGINVPVTASIICVTVCTGLASSTTNLTLTGFTYNDGQSMQTVSTNVKTNDFYIFGSKPTVVFSPTTTSGLSAGENKIGQITIAADAAGDIKINTLRIDSTLNGITGPRALMPARIAQNGLTVSGSTCGSENTDNEGETVSFSGPWKVVCYFGSTSLTDSDGYSIQAGTSVTFDVYATLTGSVSGSAGQSSIISTIKKDNFSWDDFTGVKNISAMGIYNFPTASQVKTN